MNKNIKKWIASKAKVPQKTLKEQADKSGISNGIAKQCLKSKPLCKVTFTLPGKAAPDAHSVAIVGDFNNWDTHSTLLKKLKNGSFTTTLNLTKGREYRFKYLIDGSKWENDWSADRYEPNPYGGDNSVVVI